jgi:nucleoside-diphosphate-sugar epimerase
VRSHLLSELIVFPEGGIMERVLVTGVAGEVGSSLVQYLARTKKASIVGFDLRSPTREVAELCSEIALGDISDAKCTSTLGGDHYFDTIFHLAGILSSGGERAPLKAHEVNVTGSLNILELARIHSEKRNKPVKVIFTSTIAAYGIPSIEQKRSLSAINETEALYPITMYGANKLYCESLGRYYSENFGMLEGRGDRVRVDFRAVRFPGLISAHTVPTGGTSDYASEMVHAAAQAIPYSCFVRPDTRLPFMMMPDAVRALVLLSEANANDLSQRVYNVAGFAPSAAEIGSLVSRYFPDSEVSYSVNPIRQSIVDSWPEDIDDVAARRDFGWQPVYNFEQGFAEYLIPAVKLRYSEHEHGTKGSEDRGASVQLAAN